MEIQWALVVHGLVTLLVVVSLLCGHWPIFQDTFIERIQYFITSGAYDYFLRFVAVIFGSRGRNCFLVVEHYFCGRPNPILQAKHFFPQGMNQRVKKTERERGGEEVLQLESLEELVVLLFGPVLPRLGDGVRFPDLLVGVLWHGGGGRAGGGQGARGPRERHAHRTAVLLVVLTRAQEEASTSASAAAAAATATCSSIAAVVRRKSEFSQLSLEISRHEPDSFHNMGYNFAMMLFCGVMMTLDRHFLICLYGAVVLGFILAGELKERRVIYILTVYYGVENSFSSLFPYIVQWLVASYNTQILLIMFLAIVSLLLAGFFGYHAHLCLTNTTTNETFKWQDYISWKRKLNEAKSSAAALKASIHAVTGESNPPKSKWRAFFRRSPLQNEEVVVKNNVYDQGIASNLFEIVFPLSERRSFFCRKSE
uniref:Probable protein S-acyltransferase 17 n=1 Tax=Elaeis guineensis var. tenera TaxID=51953 RepID=A0A8N4ET72_ELAGV|nr:probable protein S-acyltransferase 17 [Elaeis guineensis]